MQARPDYSHAAPAAFKTMLALEAAVHRSSKLGRVALAGVCG